jgi:hypothetical protein
MIDVVIPAHKKDIDTLEFCIDGVKNNVNRLGKVYVISRERLTENAEWIPESEFPFSIDDVSNFTGKHWRTCWYYQQLLKMYVFEVRKDISDSVLVLDSDTVFLKKTDFISETNTPGTVGFFNVGKEFYAPYFEHMNRLIPGLSRQIHQYSGITHHMVFQKDIMKCLFDEVENIHGCGFWEAFLQCTIAHYPTIGGDQSHKGQGRASEYEIYFNYCLSKFPNRTKIRKLNSILAYKEGLGGNENEVYHVGSRTNDDQHIKTMEEYPEFNTLEESFEYAINNTREQGYDSVTFQKHTRQGIVEYIEDGENYIMEVCDDSNR